MRSQGRVGQSFTHRSMKPKVVVVEVRKRQKNLGPDTVGFAWVKAHVGTQDDEKAEQMAIQSRVGR